MKTILFTGASGRIGRCLRYALRDDYRLVLFNRSAIDDLGPNETLVRGDTTDAGAIEGAARGADAIVDMAGVSDVAPFREKLLPTNILGTYNVFEAARLAGVPRSCTPARTMSWGITRRINASMRPRPIVRAACTA